jgi:hypothetical protein
VDQYLALQRDALTEACAKGASADDPHDGEHDQHLGTASEQVGSRCGFGYLLKRLSVPAT